MAEGEAIPRAAMRPIGTPDGPEIWVEGLGMKVPTFLADPQDLVTAANRRGIPMLRYHVPIDKRGKYQIHNAEVGPNGERLDKNRYALCTAMVKPGRTNNNAETSPCRAVALHWSGLCSAHGGALHPLDKMDVDWDQVPRHVRFANGRLPVEELDDEELARGQIRLANGLWTNYKRVPVDVHDAMIKQLFERADTKLRENLVKAVDVMAEIAGSSVVEPADRINAAKWIYERVRGKVASEVKITQDKPFEVVLGAVLTGGTRAARRAERGIGSDTPNASIEGVVDAEFQIEDASVDANLSEALYDEDLEDEGRYNARTHPAAASPPQPVVLPVSVPPADQPPGIKLGPPEDPILRDEYEKAKAEQKAQEIKDFKDRISKARAKRYSARAQGFDDVVPQPYDLEVEDSPEDGPTAVKVFWIEPKQPKANKAADKREQKRSRKRDWE